MAAATHTPVTPTGPTPRLGFRARLAASQVALLLALMMVLVLTSIVTARETIEGGLRRQVESQAELIATASALDLSLLADLDAGALGVDLEGMRGLLVGIGHDPQVVEAVVFEADRSPCLAYGRADGAWELVPQPALRALTLPTEGERADGPFVTCVTPVVAQDGATVGWVELRASKVAVERLTEEQVRVMALVGLVALLATACLSVLMGNRVTRSVAALSDAAARIGAGEREARAVEPPGDDELSALIRTFNQTMDRLAAASDALASANAGFERANAELHQANTRLEALNRELDAFTYSVSHDLRAPLRGMDGFSAALLEDYGDKVDDTGRDYLQRIRAGAQRMGKLIDDLLGLSRLSQAELKKEQVDLGQLATPIVARLRAADPRRDVTVDLAPGLVATGDPALLSAALENLLGNAWKYSGKRADARVELGASVVDGRTTYHVRDNGAGFDMAHAGKLFGAFQRLHAVAEFEGTGIGLATVQRIITRHGGRVWAEAEVGRGATFYFTLGG